MWMRSFRTHPYLTELRNDFQSDMHSFDGRRQLHQVIWLPPQKALNTFLILSPICELLANHQHAGG